MDSAPFQRHDAPALSSFGMNHIVQVLLLSAYKVTTKLAVLVSIRSAHICYPINHSPLETSGLTLWIATASLFGPNLINERIIIDASLHAYLPPSIRGPNAKRQLTEFALDLRLWKHPVPISTMAKWFNAPATDLIIDTQRVINGVSVKMAARRYLPSGSSLSAAGLTLLCLHGIGSHKELWEPILENVFQHRCAADAKLPSIREIWLLDCQNHGDSALLNASIEWSKESLFSTEWAAAVAFFHETYLKSHRVVCVCNSGGALAALGSVRYLHHWRAIPYEAAILVEPTVAPRSTTPEDLDAWIERLKATSRAAIRRRDVWNSYQDAFAYFTKRYPWKEWDKHMVQLFVEHGLRPIRDDDLRVTLKCPKHLEADTYGVPAEIVILAMEEIERLCDKIPVHILFGEYDDFMPEHCKTYIRDMGCAGRITSVTSVPEAGHFVALEKPFAVAQWLRQTLVRLNLPSSVAVPGSQGLASNRAVAASARL
ncbi:hypothetical protein NM688_g4115 [Phlebia brevispora]|uniref:Uncharacterized protein n=1 Tax=Phlebia brevispora TaxID=194682 RepID=A0ACC1T416_9APHY|nr:hypothetical protein NM688_g4115 [Phlebia brevispora]